MLAILHNLFVACVHSLGLWYFQYKREKISTESKARRRSRYPRGTLMRSKYTCTTSVSDWLVVSCLLLLLWLECSLFVASVLFWFYSWVSFLVITVVTFPETNVDSVFDATCLVCTPIYLSRLTAQFSTGNDFIIFYVGEKLFRMHAWNLFQDRVWCSSSILNSAPSILNSAPAERFH